MCIGAIHTLPNVSVIPNLRLSYSAEDDNNHPFACQARPFESSITLTLEISLVELLTYITPGKSKLGVFITNIAIY